MVYKGFLFNNVAFLMATNSYRHVGIRRIDDETRYLNDVMVCPISIIDPNLDDLLPSIKSKLDVLIPITRNDEKKLVSLLKTPESFKEFSIELNLKLLISVIQKINSIILDVKEGILMPDNDTIREYIAYREWMQDWDVTIDYWAGKTSWMYDAVNLLKEFEKETEYSLV